MTPYFVYFARRRDNPKVIKIGLSKVVKYRLAVIGCELLVAVPYESRKTAGVVERELHARFADSRIFGEWFWMTPDMATLVAAAKDMP
jgi:hypothetical protein